MLNAVVFVVAPGALHAAAHPAAAVAASAAARKRSTAAASDPSVDRGFP